MIIIITATSPGTIVFRLKSSSLYQTRLADTIGGRPDSLRQPDAGRVGLHDCLQVREHDGGRVGVAAVYDGLQLCGAAGVDIGREVGRNHEHQLGSGSLEQGANLGRAREVPGELEVAGRPQGVEQRAAWARRALIEHGGPDIADIPRDGVSEQDQEEERQREGQNQAPGVAPELDGFFSRDR